MPFSPQSIDSKAVHGGEIRRYAPRDKRVTSAPVVGGIAPSIGYVYEDTAHLDSALGGDPNLYVYGRYGNPTVAAFERAMVDLECHDMPERTVDHFALATGSGMAAIHLAMAACGIEAGATVAAAQDCYGATYSLVDSLWPQYGAKGVFVDATDLDAVERMLAEEAPVALVVETISNPLVKVMDIPRLAEMCQAPTTPSCWLTIHLHTPMLFRPLAHGVDVVQSIHSATKYIGGHGDVLGGVVNGAQRVASRLLGISEKDRRQPRPPRSLAAASGDQDDAAAGGASMPQRLYCGRATEPSPGPCAHVRYPGLPDHPQYELAGRLFGRRGHGAVIAIELKDAGREDVFRFLEALQMVQPATTVGDLYTLVLYPSHSSHRALSPAQRAAVGISDGLVRLAVGVEEPQDIVADICAALEG